jgi:hypothetical protein
MLNKQEVIDVKVPVPILRNEIEELELQEQVGRFMLVNRFPRNLVYEGVKDQPTSYRLLIPKTSST